MNDATQEDRLVAAMSHASAMLPLIGIAIPIGVWLSQKDRSALIRFQALQALAYQFLGLLIFVLVLACQMLGSIATFPAMMIPVAFLENPQTQAVNTAAGVVYLIVMGLFCIVGILFNGLMCVGGPTYIIIALVGARRILKGDEFYYPILGRWIKERYAKETLES